MLNWISDRMKPFAMYGRLAANRRAPAPDLRTRLTLQLLEDRQVLAMVFDPTFTHVSGVVPNWPGGHVAVFVPGEAAAMVRQPLDGKFVLGGWADSPTRPGAKNFGVVRLNESGLPDNSFGTNGIVNVPFHGIEDRISGLALDTITDPFQTKIVVAGRAKVGLSGPYEFSVMRFHSNGSA
jgi:hypothetical protein